MWFKKIINNTKKINTFKMKKIYYSLLGVTLLCIAACVPADHATSVEVLSFKGNDIEALNDREPLPKPHLDKTFLAIMQRSNDFHWANIDDYHFWSAVNAVEPLVAIGYQPSHYKGNISEEIHKIDIHSEPWQSTHDAIIDFIKMSLKEKNEDTQNDENLIYEDDAVLPRIVVRLTDYETIAKLRRIENIRYIEPLDFDFSEADERSSSGCGGTAVTAMPTADVSTTTPNARIPWNYNNMNIPAAWNIAGAMNGTGITIGVIDAGISNTQPLLNAQFNTGTSTGRSVTTGFTFGTSAFTSCTHGTSMAGLAVGPRNNSGATMGVAWKSNLHFIRACEDVVLDGADERTGVKNALVQMGNNPNIRIISMSIGTPFSSGTLEDGVNYAYNNGKLIFAAGGTSFSLTSWWGVIYPAKLDKCVAMTGIKENGSKCTVCHDGSEIDFTMTMERTANSNRTSLSYHSTGTLPSYVGGSSTATAMGAGVAALVWSSNPTLTRDQVLNILKTTAQFYPNKNSSKGWGNINASAAVNAAISQP
jgi:serine protease